MKSTISKKVIIIKIINQEISQINNKTTTNPNLNSTISNNSRITKKETEWEARIKDSNKISSNQTNLRTPISSISIKKNRIKNNIKSNSTMILSITRERIDIKTNNSNNNLPRIITNSTSLPLKTTSNQTYKLLHLTEVKDQLEVNLSSKNRDLNSTNRESDKNKRDKNKKEKSKKE